MFAYKGVKKFRKEKIINGKNKYECTTCLRMLDYEDFYSTGIGIDTKCKECTSKSRRVKYKGMSPADILKSLKKET